MSKDNLPLGIGLMVFTTLVFAVQDAISKHLASAYNPIQTVMIRYWFFAAFVIFLAMRHKGGLRMAARSGMPKVQVLRSLVLVLEICVMVTAFTVLGLIESHAVFASYPLIIAALSGPILGERVGWRRWAAIGVGFIGMIIILDPSAGVFSLGALIPLCSAILFALYGLLTRYVSRVDDAQTSLFYTGTVGAVAVTVVGIWLWEPMIGPDRWIMAILCVTGVMGHFTLIKCYDVAEASAVQPFAYLQLVFVFVFGLAMGEVLRQEALIGSLIIIAAGIFTLVRSKKAARL